MKYLILLLALTSTAANADTLTNESACLRMVAGALTLDKADATLISAIRNGYEGFYAYTPHMAYFCKVRKKPGYKHLIFEFPGKPKLYATFSFAGNDHAPSMVLSETPSGSNQYTKADCAEALDKHGRDTLNERMRTGIEDHVKRYKFAIMTPEQDDYHKHLVDVCSPIEEFKKILNPSATSPDGKKIEDNGPAKGNRG